MTIKQYGFIFLTVLAALILFTVSYNALSGTKEEETQNQSQFAPRVYN